MLHEALRIRVTSMTAIACRPFREECVLRRRAPLAGSTTTVSLSVHRTSRKTRRSCEADVQPRLLPRGIAVYDVTSGTCLRAFQLDQPPGTILAVGRHHVLSLYGHPKLIDLSSGQILHAWTELRSGLQDGSIVWGFNEGSKPPPMAFDPVSRRFAIANGHAVTVIEFNHSALNSQ